MTEIPAEPSSRYRTCVLGTLTLVLVGIYPDRQLLVVPREPIKGELGLSGTQLGLLSGLVLSAGAAGGRP